MKGVVMCGRGKGCADVWEREGVCGWCADTTVYIYEHKD